MKKILLLTASLFLVITAFCQVPEENEGGQQVPIGPPSFIEKGDNIGVNVSIDASGTTTVTVVCVCSEAECFRVFNVANAGGPDLEDDCGATGLGNHLTTNPAGFNSTVYVGANVIATGILTGASNSATNGDPLTRTNVLTLQ